jgi:hypothetical protein
MGLRCTPGTNCTPALFDDPPDPAWANGQTQTYTNSVTNGQPFTYQPQSIPAWVTASVTSAGVTFSGTRPNGLGFSLTYQTISCGVATSYILDYPGPSSLCVQCTFTLVGF